jgi:hypothetical protein
METGHVVPTGSVERRDSVVDVPSERHLQRRLSMNAII